MVARIPRLKRENGGAKQQRQGSAASSSFGVALDKTVEENRVEERCVVTYNAKRQLQTFYYSESKEYTY